MSFTYLDTVRLFNGKLFPISLALYDFGVYALGIRLFRHNLVLVVVLLPWDRVCLPVDDTRYSNQSSLTW